MPLIFLYYSTLSGIACALHRQSEEKSDSEQRFDQKLQEFVCTKNRQSILIDRLQTLLFWCGSCGTVRMYCLQWLIPVLLLPKPVRFSRNFLLTKCCDNFSQVNPALLYNHVMFIVLYLTGFFLEKKPCTICSLVSHNFYFSTFFKQFEF